MSAALASDLHREAMNDLWKALVPPCERAFMHEGLIFFGVPKYQVTAYVKARFEGVLDLVTVSATALVGKDAVATHGGDEGWAGWMIARGYVKALRTAEASLPAARRGPGVAAAA